MFDEGAKLDDIINVLRPPTLDKDDDKKIAPCPTRQFVTRCRKNLSATTQFILNSHDKQIRRY